MQQKNRQQHGLRLQLSELRQNIDLGSDPKYQGTEQEIDRENLTSPIRDFSEHSCVFPDDTP
jgi:hypothetical protein